MAFLEVNNVSKRIENIDILSNVSLSFDSTGLVFIVGKSGAGKSTLMNIIGQLDHEYDGQIILENNLWDLECGLHLRSYLSVIIFYAMILM